MRKHSLRIVWLVFIFVPLYGAGQKQDQNAIVHIKIVDYPGQDLGEPKVEEFRSGRDGKDFADRFRHGSASGIPFTQYHLRVNNVGFYAAEREVRVFQPEVWVVLGLALGEEGGPYPYQLAGHIKGQDASKGALWIRLSGVYSEIMMDSKASDAGDFAFSGIIQGHYVLIISQNGSVLNVRPVDIPFDGPLLIGVEGKQ